MAPPTVHPQAPEETERREFQINVTTTLTKSTLVKLRELARRENRSVSSFIRLELLKVLRRRKVA